MCLWSNKETGKCWKHSPVRIFDMPEQQANKNQLLIKIDQIYEKIYQRQGSSVRKFPTKNVFYYETNFIYFNRLIIKPIGYRKLFAKCAGLA